jgi:glycolate oxidase FAD binding subunit
VKVLPRAPREATLVFEDVAEVDAIRRLNEWAGQPLPVSASCWHDGVLALRLSGANAAVDAAIRALGGDVMPDCARFWESLREQRHAFFEGKDDPDAAVWRLSVPSTVGAIVLGAAQLIEWGGSQRWLRAPGDAQTAERIRATVRACGGHATLFRGGDKSVGVFPPLARPVAAIHERLKAGFDPSGLFNPGRMY